MSKLLIAAVAVVLLFSCRKDDYTDGAGLQSFAERRECGLWSHGGFLFRYDEESCQFSINPVRRQIRMQSDNQDDYVNILFSALPTPAMTKVEASLRYKVGNEEISNIANMETVKIDGNKFWLWDNSNNLGLIVCLDCGTGK